MLKHAHQGRKGQTVIYCETQVQNNFKDKLKRVRSPCSNPCTSRIEATRAKFFASAKNKKRLMTSAISGVSSTIRIAEVNLEMAARNQFPLQPGTDNVEYQGNGTWSIHHPKMINEQIENQVEGGIPALRPGDWDSVVHTPPQN